MLQMLTSAQICIGKDALKEKGCFQFSGGKKYNIGMVVYVLCCDALSFCKGDCSKGKNGKAAVRIRSKKGFQGSWDFPAHCPRNRIQATLLYVNASYRDFPANV